jgi:hypothetical protein
MPRHTLLAASIAALFTPRMPAVQIAPAMRSDSFERDDTAVLQALVDGAPWSDDPFRHLPAGVYRVTSAIRF